MILTGHLKNIVAGAFIAKTERPHKVQKMCLVRTAVTDYHSPSQSSEVQLNSPPWHTLEEVRRRIRQGRLYSMWDKTVRLILLNTDTSMPPPCHSVETIRLYQMIIKTTMR